MIDLEALTGRMAAIDPVRRLGRVAHLSRASLRVTGLSGDAALGDRLKIACRSGDALMAEIVEVGADACRAQPEGSTDGVLVGDLAALQPPACLAPDDSWLGRVIGPEGQPLDDRPLRSGARARALAAPPPPAAERRRLGPRLDTGMAATDTFLPLVRGQRVGLFAGSGVGKSTLLGNLARGIAADVVVIALIGERGRELREFVEATLGPAGLARAVVIAATSDQPALLRRRCAWAALAVAEHFRDRGDHVLLLADSITRFAEAHREIALSAGEAPSLRGYPPSVAPAIMALAERAGPGSGDAGDITAIFSVLVPGSDMEEPVADILRGTLDGHVVLDRAIAERGRFPAIDLLRSVSRSLPDAASAEENALLTRARHLMGSYERAEMMVGAGLYAPGSDPVLDEAIRVWPLLDGLMGRAGMAGCADSFAALAACLDAAAIPGGGVPSRG